MPSMKAGQLAPDFTLSTVEGRLVSLADLRMPGNHVLLVFLRHLG